MQAFTNQIRVWLQDVLDSSFRRKTSKIRDRECIKDVTAAARDAIGQAQHAKYGGYARTETLDTLGPWATDSLAEEVTPSVKQDHGS